ncbi:MAG: class I SAM-dependent methyltransferase [Cyanobacteria bacterium J06634_5]
MTSNNYESLNLTQKVSEKDSFTEERYKQFYQFFPKTASTALDIGCNTGRGGRVLKQQDSNIEIFGLDCVQSRLDRLSKDIYKSGIYGLSTDIPCEDNSFDVVVAGELIEHLYPADVDKTLTEIFRVLKLNGKLLLTTPNPLDIKKQIQGRTVLGGAHLSQHFPDALALKLRMFGFSSVRIFGSGKVSRYLGYHFPFQRIYGSYLATGTKF